ncbi:hypothetical protein CcCBS67573_g03153 [Chytriomyces confervae]|uniref:Endonuclease/exonuclease/phosphatase domain-containing protein n=1 Tax=Chytriomyces confervae TaxID=246404 RepID=A0A507FJU9_9FUNG|nr:hypothetical protein CcCBS67573_g03153 [Chytriomyces confervae]
MFCCNSTDSDQDSITAFKTKTGAQSIQPLMSTLAIDSKNPNTNSNNNTLRLLTQNCKLLLVVGEWPVMPISAPERARLLAEKLLERRCDVVGLNEVFLKEPTAILKTAFEANGYNVLASIPATTTWYPSIRVNSGLFLASKLPILSHDFYEYTHSSGMDQFSRKGVLVAELDQKGAGRAGRLFVAISHHQSEGSDVVMTSQFQAAGKFVEEFVLSRVSSDSELSDTVVLYFGDMNVADSDTPKLYTSLLESLSTQTEDLFKTCNPTDDKGFTFPANDPKQRLDYFFALREFKSRKGVAVGQSQKPETVRVDRLVVEGPSVELSDHLGLLAEMNM